jgi:ABC-type lipoprotein export system ATPase subunit
LLKIHDLKTALIGPVTLDIAPGECVAVVGRSGTGKSLLMRAIVDLDVNEGSVRLEDLDRDQMPASAWRKLVALVPSESGWWADEVRYNFDDPDAAGPFLPQLGLSDALNWEVARLSSGERSRLALARALCNAPRALLLNEPTASLDQENTDAVEVLIASQLAGGTALLLVTHDRTQAARLAARTYEMKDGGLHLLEVAP